MKKSTIFFALMSILLIQSTLIFAQKGNATMPTPNVVVGTVVADNRPDLIVTSFTKGSTIVADQIENGVTYIAYTISYKAVVKNQGKTATNKPCELSDPRESVEGCAVIPILQAGQSVTVEGTLKGKASGHVINLYLMADLPNCSYEDNPDPSYGEINEANEENNKSTSITVNLH